MISIYKTISQETKKGVWFVNETTENAQIQTHRPNRDGAKRSKCFH